MDPVPEQVKAIQEVMLEHSLKDIAILSTMEFEEFIVVVIKGSIGSFIGKEGKILRELNKRLNKKIRVVERSKNEKKMMQDLAGKARVLGVNKVFSPERVLCKVRIDERDKNKLMLGEEAFTKAMKVLLGENTVIDYIRF